MYSGRERSWAGYDFLCDVGLVTGVGERSMFDIHLLSCYTYRYLSVVSGVRRYCYVVGTSLAVLAVSNGY